MFSIAHKKSKGNCDTEQKFTAVSSESRAISQTCMDCHSICDAGMHEAIANLRGYGRLKDQMAAEILSGPNEKALDILRSCGCQIFIPGTVFTTLNEFAKFYGVTRQYVLSILNRWGITGRKTPKDCVKADFNFFAVEHGILDRFSVSQRYQSYVLCDRVTHRQMTFGHSKNGNFYSSRVVLAFAAMMYFGKNIHPDAVGNRVYQTLMGSTYCDAAQTAIARQMEAKRKAESTKVTEQPVENAEHSATLSENGQITLTAEFFAEIIKIAVHEAVSECVKSITQSVEPVTTATPGGSSHAERPRVYVHNRLSKPDNWDAVVGAYASGSITRRHAAELTGMCVTSFDNYRTGKRQFLS